MSQCRRLSGGVCGGNDGRRRGSLARAGAGYTRESRESGKEGGGTDGVVLRAGDHRGYNRAIRHQGGIP